MRSDAEIEAYLDLVDAYAEAKQHAASAWKQAFLSLAKVQISGEVGTTVHDPELKAATTAQGSSPLELGPSSPKQLQAVLAAAAGAWPSQTLKATQREFLTALKYEVEAKRNQTLINETVHG